MKYTESLPLYYWLMDQFADTRPEGCTWREIVQIARGAFLSQARIALAKSGQKTPPFDPFAIAAQRGIHSITWTQSGEEASLIPDRDGFSLIIRKPRTRNSVEPKKPESHPRIRTTLAHEIGHTFFFDIESRPPAAGPERYKLEGTSWLKTRSEEEWWCFDFARELLLPRVYVTPFLTNRAKIDLGFIRKLRIRFNVTWDLLLRRLVYDFKAVNNSIIFRLRFDGSDVYLKDLRRDVWNGNASRIRKPSRWFQDYKEFLEDSLGALDVGDKTSRSSARVLSPDRKYLSEFLRIHTEPSTFLCSVSLVGPQLDDYFLVAE